MAGGLRLAKAELEVLRRQRHEAKAQRKQARHLSTLKCSGTLKGFKRI